MTASTIARFPAPDEGRGALGAARRTPENDA